MAAALQHYSTLDEAVSRELLEAYYWTRTFRFSHMDLALVHTFLHTDTHGWAVLPALCARRVQLQIQPFASVCVHTSGPKAISFDARSCTRATEAFAAIPSRRILVDVLVDVAQGSMQEAEYERCADEVSLFLLEVMRLVQSEKERGVRVKLAFSDTWDEK